MNKYIFYYFVSQEDYINGRNMRNYEIQTKNFQQAFGAYTSFLRDNDSCNTSCVYYCCNSSIKAIPKKYVGLLNTHFVGF